jgi:hypothetical protein
VWVFVAEWQDVAQDAAALEELRALHLAVVNVAKEKGLYVRYEFMNDAGHAQKVLDSYGPESLKRLRDTAAKFDPEQLFQMQHDGHLLRKL